MGPIRVPTADATIALFLLVKLGQGSFIGLFGHFRVHDSLSYLFILPLNFLLPEGPSAEVGPTTHFAAVAEQTSVR